MSLTHIAYGPVGQAAKFRGSDDLFTGAVYPVVPTNASVACSNTFWPVSEQSFVSREAAATCKSGLPQ